MDIVLLKADFFKKKKFEFFIFHNNDTFQYFVLYKSIKYALSCILFYYILYTP